MKCSVRLQLQAHTQQAGRRNVGCVCFPGTHKEHNACNIATCRCTPAHSTNVMWHTCLCDQHAQLDRQGQSVACTAAAAHAISRTHPHMPGPCSQVIIIVHFPSIIPSACLQLDTGQHFFADTVPYDKASLALSAQLGQVKLQTAGTTVLSTALRLAQY